MAKKQQSKQGIGHFGEKMALPLETQLRLAETKRQLAVARYKLGVRRGSAWLKPSEKMGRHK